ncbi:hypothetical protein CM15mP35_03900 [bacterium]|nr:MAG: hypothetical protein CM15mP35_03900 [bacterium]
MNQLFLYLKKIIKELNIKNFNTNTYPNQNQDELISSIAKYNNVQQDNILIYAGSDEALKDIFTIFLDSSKSCLVKFQRILKSLLIFCLTLVILFWTKSSIHFLHMS